MSGCINGGVCNSDNGQCGCPAPFIGPDCSELPDCTSDGDCMHAGVCNITGGSCDCESLFVGSLDATNLSAPVLAQSFGTGKLCERGNDCRNDGVDCYNGGSCNALGFCQCVSPYTGWLCDFIVDDGTN